LDGFGFLVYFDRNDSEYCVINKATSFAPK